VKLLFQHQGPVVVIHRHLRGGENKHTARRLTIHACSSPFQPYPVSQVSYVEKRFNALTEFPITEDCQRYCEVLAPNGTRLFDSRDLIPWEPLRPVSKPVPLEHDGKRLHPRHFREMRNQ
jgi:hypothetical protein